MLVHKDVALEQPSGDRKAVALDHLVFRRHREGDAEIDQSLQELVGQIVAMDDVDVGPDQAGLDQLLKFLHMKA